MTESHLRAEDFGKFFARLWDKPPFRWQEELAKRVLESEKTSMGSPNGNVSPIADEATPSPWPEAIALPTASGKTACMDIALFALAVQASRPDSGRPIAAPRRIFFVVDRRTIVDEAHERARRLAQKLADAGGGILKVVADRLRRVAHGSATGFEDELPLAVHALRGGMYRSEAWARNPLQPMIVASTVDQVGSRLLFRAYGRGSGTWPVYAGLAANDSLVLLDEAHCARPFFQTLQAVRRFRGEAWAQKPLGRCFHPVVMSATPPPGLKDVFRDTSDEGRNPCLPLGRRQLAGKPAALRKVPNASGDDAVDGFSGELAQAALDMLGDDRRAIVVFVNRVATARETHRILRDNAGVTAVLLTGRMRPVDRDAAVRRLKKLDLHSDRSADRDLKKPVIVVSTQTLEVGADLDFDALVTECASLDALRQRFGRLNRMGRDVAARAAILIRADEARPRRGAGPDPIYGEALTKTWQWLEENRNEEGEVDFGIARLQRSLTRSGPLADLDAPSPDAPAMLPAHVDCWAQTAPAPCPSPDVAHFLRGPRTGEPDVRVCWRADLDLTDTGAQDDALESLTLCPPSSGETLPAPTGVFKRWLAGEDSEDPGADVEGIQTADRVVTASDHADRRIVRWRGAGTDRGDITSDPAHIRPGDTIVIPTMHPGPHDRLGDLPPEAFDPPAALDVGDAAHRVARARPVLRLHPALVDAWPDGMAARATARSLLNGVELKYENDSHDVADAAHRLLTELSAVEGLPDRWAWLPQVAGELRTEFPTAARLRRGCRLAGGQCLVLAGDRRIDALARDAAVFSDEDDAASSGLSHRNGAPAPLRTHLPGVEDFAHRHAAGCGLPDDLARTVALAGLLHDVGKADPRFQSLLRGGSPWLTGEILAKSAEMPRTRAAWERARDDAGYPAGGRHELLSVRMAETAPALLPEDDELRELLLHLVASHHGYCRPFAPAVVDDGPVSAEYKLRGHRMRWSGPTDLERLDSGVADRYWRLTRRYGWWGLAWLEALLRLADWRRSEWEEAHDAEG